MFRKILNGLDEILSKRWVYVILAILMAISSLSVILSFALSIILQNHLIAMFAIISFFILSLLSIRSLDLIDKETEHKTIERTIVIDGEEVKIRFHYTKTVNSKEFNLSHSSVV